MHQWKHVVGSIVIGIALAGCGGGDSAPTPEPAPPAPVAPEPPPPPPPIPMTYSGTMSFGDTISITKDAPSGDRLKIRFVDSAFGLSGTLVGDYTPVDGYITVSNLAADSADPPPAALTAQLAGITFTFRLSGGQLSGEVAGLPNLLGASTDKLAGDISTSLVTIDPPTLSSLAGTYNVVMQFTMWDKSTGKPVTPPAAAPARVQIDTDGNAKLCTGADVVTCATSQAATLTLADQTRFPGAFDLTSASPYFKGRVFVTAHGGLRFDMNSSDDKMVATGTWVIEPVKALVAGDLDGVWSCARANWVADGAGVVMDGSLLRETLTIGGGKVAATGAGKTVPLMMNDFNGQVMEGFAIAADIPADPAAPVDPATYGHIFMKSGPDSLAWLPVTPAAVPMLGNCHRAS
jgi:hypothetical protein